MHTMVRYRTARWISAMLLGILTVPYLCTAAAAADKVRIDTYKQTVMVFPLDKPGTMDKESLVDEMNTFLMDGLSTSRKYEAIRYSDRLPAVQRMIAMESEMKSFENGFSNDSASISKAVNIGKATASDLIIIGSINKYTFNPKDSSAEIEVEVQLINTENGKTVRTVSITGRGTKPSPSAPGTENSIASEAVRDAGRSILEQLTGEPYKEIKPIATEQTTIRDKKKKSWIPFLLISLGAGILLGGSGGGSSSSSTGGGGGGLDQPPAVP